LAQFFFQFWLGLMLPIMFGISFIRRLLK